MSDACGRRGDRCAPQSPSRTNPSPAGADGQGARFLSSPVFPSAPLALVRQPSAEASANTPHPRPKFPFNGRRPPSASNPTLDRSPLSLAPPLASLSPSSPPSLESRGTHHIHTRPAKSRSPHPPPPLLTCGPTVSPPGVMFISERPASQRLLDAMSTPGRSPPRPPI